MFANKKEKLLITLSGAICALAFAPFDLFFPAIISLSSFFYFLQKAQNKKEIILTSFLYGFGYYLASIYWISISLLVDIAQFGWMIPFALTLIPSFLAIYFILFALSYKFTIKKFQFNQTWQQILIFALFWLFFEILRSYLFTGFPWNLLGYVWMFNQNFFQLASVFSIFGLSFFACIIALFPMLFCQNGKFVKFKLLTSGNKILVFLSLIFFIGNFLFGFNYIDDQKLVKKDGANFRIIQGNIRQDLKWDANLKYQNFIKHIKIANSKPLTNIDAVILSETSIPYLVTNNKELMSKIALATPKNGYLISGGLNATYDSFGYLEQIFNSVFVFNKGQIFTKYNKHHLVPFGEYVPLQKYFPFIKKITGGGQGFNKGQGAQTLNLNKFSFSPLICYEVIFTSQVLDRKTNPDLFINVTNDAWFGKSSGPYQHFNMTKMRAVEYGIPLIRAANSGISAFIDPFGREIAKINLNEEGFIDVKLVNKISPTIYFKYGFLPLLILIITTLLILLITPIKPCPINHQKQN